MRAGGRRRLRRHAERWHRFQSFRLARLRCAAATVAGDPGLQYVAPDGTVTYLATRVDDGTPMNAPNDLVVTADGTVYFTDPGHYPLPDPPIGRVLEVDPRRRRVGCRRALPLLQRHRSRSTRARCSSSRPAASCVFTTMARGNGSSSNSGNLRATASASTSRATRTFAAPPRTASRSRPRSARGRAARPGAVGRQRHGDELLLRRRRWAHIVCDALPSPAPW